MHAVIRTYSGTGARQLAEILKAHREDVEITMKPIAGFVSYTLVETADGCVTVTICNDKAGTDESVSRAAAWVKKNAAGTGVAPPAVAEGSVIIHTT